MLSWIFNKPEDADEPEGETAAPARAVLTDEQRAAQREEAKALWMPRLLAAQGVDDDLLGILQQAPLTEIKLAAIEGLTGEAALKVAERELRKHDRRLHRAAKGRLDAAVARREARAEAYALIAQAKALGSESPLPVNRLVALDRAWASLDAEHLVPEQQTEFVELRSQLDARLRQAGEEEHRSLNWLAAVEPAVEQAERDMENIAKAGSAEAVTAVVAAMQALIQGAPEGRTGADGQKRLQTVLDTALALHVRLRWLEGQQLVASTVDRGIEESTPAVAPAPSDGTAVEHAALTEPTAVEEAGTEVESKTATNSSAEMEAGAKAESIAVAITDSATGSASASGTDPAADVSFAPPAQVATWGSLPAVQDAALDALLQARYHAWAQAGIAGSASGAHGHGSTHHTQPESEEDAAQRAEHLRSFTEQLQHAEAALAEGQIADLQGVLQALDSQLPSARNRAPWDALLGRLQAVQAEFARLKGWQQWSNARAIDDLVTQAEALARFTQAAGKPGAPKLAVKAHGEAIASMRKQWKELSQQGAPAPQALWRRFDAALQIAHQPVAAHIEALNAARQENLKAREALLEALDAVLLEGASDSKSKTGVATSAATDPASEGVMAEDATADNRDAPADDPIAQPDAAQSSEGNAAADTSHEPMPWKEVARALDRFHSAWRQLGPPEHTVAPASRKGLNARLQASLQRLEAPLAQERAQAQARREQLVVQAEALAAQSDNPRRDAPAQVRELSARWREEASALPLARKVETALWNRFKKACDTVFAQRVAAQTAREAQWAANVASRQALLQRAEELPQSATARDIRAMVAELDEAWNTPIDFPRAAIPALEKRHRAARENTAARLAQYGQQRWLAQCDALAQALGLVTPAPQPDSENGATPAADAAPGDHQASLALPPTWAQAVASRGAAPAQPGAKGAGKGGAPQLLTEAAIDDCVLALEAALHVPASPESLAARQQWKLRALKDALEGRGMQARPGSAPVAATLVTLLQQPRFTDGQRARLAAVVQALRQQPPGALGLPVVAS